MTLALALPPDGVADVLLQWPTKPAVYRRDTDTLDQIASPRILTDWVTTGCIPHRELAVVKNGATINGGAYARPDGRTDGHRLNHLLDMGYTIRLGHADRYIPAMARATEQIQSETGYSNYITLFITPPGEQGLNHHWDQALSLVAQIGGDKSWELWAPIVEEPMRNIGDSRKSLQPDQVQRWKDAGPDMVVDLHPGDTLIVPRGWVHNPFAIGDQPSVHATFAIVERTRFWLIEHLTALALTDPRFRRILQPAHLVGPALTEQVSETRDLFAGFLADLDPGELADALHTAALHESEITT